jgi:hypothetical protein
MTPNLKPVFSHLATVDRHYLSDGLGYPQGAPLQVICAAGWFHTPEEKSLSPLQWTFALSPKFISGRLKTKYQGFYIFLFLYETALLQVICVGVSLVGTLHAEASEAVVQEVSLTISKLK